MTLRRALLLFISLGMIAALVACSSSSTPPPPPPPVVSIAATSGSGQAAPVGTAFAAPLVATVTTGGTPTAGVTVTFTAPASGASGTFSGGTATESDTTDSNGVATSSAFTANTTTGAYSVTASTTGASSSASFNLTNNGAPVLAAGNYVYYVAGTDSGANATGSSSAYFVAGVFTTDGNGNITGGEQDFSDYYYFAQADAITGGSLAASTTAGDTNLTITLNTADTGIGPGASAGPGSGTIVLNASMASSTKGLLTEYDSWATGSGYLDLQTSTAALCPSAPCGYAFAVNGLDANGYAAAFGGVVTVDGASGAISGTGSVFDVNDECDFLTACGFATYSGQTFTASSVSAPDSLGFVQFTLNSSLYSNTSGFAGMLLDGYMIDANHIRIVEDWLDDWYAGTTGGLAVAQTGTGAFSSTSISGSSYVFGMNGSDSFNILQNAGVLTFNSGGTVSGTLSFNDLTTQTPQGGTALTGGTYAVDSTGRVSITNVTDGATFNYNLQLYLSGGTEAVMISMDATNTNYDVLGGLSWQQGTGAFDLTTISGDYALALDESTGIGVEADAVGLLTSDGAGTLGGYLDQNLSLAGGGLQPAQPLNATLATTSTNGVYAVSPNNGTTYTSYIIDGTQGVVLEDDSSQTSLGYFANQ